MKGLCISIASVPSICGLESGSEMLQMLYHSEVAPSEFVSLYLDMILDEQSSRKSLNK